MGFRAVNKAPFDILFLGSDAFSVGALSVLLRNPDVWSSISVVTPATREVGRKKKDLYVPALTSFALANRLPHAHIPSPSLGGIHSFLPSAPFSPLTSLNPLLLTASFGSLVPSPLLELFPPSSRLNIHPSLLPRHRGASPIQYSILEGDVETGVSILGLSDKVTDKGDLWAQKKMLMPTDATYDSLVPLLADEGGQLCVETLRAMLTGIASPKPQASNGASRAKKITSDMGVVDWTSMDAKRVDRAYRALGHQISLTTFLPPCLPAHSASTPISLHSITMAPPSTAPSSHPPGTALSLPSLDALSIICRGGGQVYVRGLQTQGRGRVVGAGEAIRGWRDGGRVPKGKKGEGELVVRLGQPPAGVSDP